MKKISLCLIVLFGLSFLDSCGSSVTPNVLPAPQNVTVTGGSTALTISWDAVSGATSYNIYWGLTSGVTKATGTKIEGATNPYLQTGLRNTTPIYYVVTAVNTHGESDASAEATGTPAFIGALETTFSAVSVSAAYTIIRVAADPSGNVYLLLPAIGLNDSILYKFNSAGTLDTSFGDGGSIAQTFSPTTCAMTGIDTDSTGSLYTSSACTNLYLMRLSKLTATGALDLTFGEGRGYVEGTSYIMGLDVNVASDNNIVVAGESLAPPRKLVLWRYNSTGTNLSIGNETTTGMPVFMGTDSLANIYAVTYPESESGDPYELWKFKSDGVTLDTSFNTTGRLPLAMEYIHPGNPIVDSSGNVYLMVAKEPAPGDEVPYLLKWDSSGASANSFGVNGALDTSTACANETISGTAQAFTIELGGSLIATGAGGEDPKNFMCALFRSSGALDTSLFEGGMAADLPNLVGIAADVDNLGRVVTANWVVTYDAEMNPSITGYQVLRYK